jgi:hypothetical protein
MKFWPLAEKSSTKNVRLYVVYFHYFVAVVIDDFDGNLAAVRAREGTADGAVEAVPRRFVDFDAQRALQLFIRLIGAGEISVADEEAFAVVFGVDEPAGNVVG